ncbi:uncharacterized protein LOC128163823 isoform X2 [Crassostrea angulata]|uniref:uncharacterized protein LOC128163823 isoform X2 n=1 Tax=Magallana angulata TaxID=2784310 RepID=UPI0022B0D87F|nr:uncharacterized protein LOC128163823 isoform X2 [Crassostrea angulata]
MMLTKLPMEWIVVLISIIVFSGGGSYACDDGRFWGHCQRNELCVCNKKNWYQTTTSEIKKVDSTKTSFSSICSCLNTDTSQTVDCRNPDLYNKLVDHLEFNKTLVLTDDTTCRQLLTAMCPCSCEYFDKIEYWSQEANQIKQYNELSQQLAQIKNILKMETKNLTAYLNTKKSVGDKRPSARATGYVGGVILVLILCCLVLLDIFKCSH